MTPKSVYLHKLDSTEGIKGNKPSFLLSASKANPFGKPGIDYSKEYPWSFTTYGVTDADAVVAWLRANTNEFGCATRVEDRFLK